jgi:PhnB protein
MSALRVITHLTFRGECEAAFLAYAECLGGKITFLAKYGEATAPPPAPELAGKVFHATLQVGEQTITGVDIAFAEYRKPQGFHVQLNLHDLRQAKQIFNTFAEGGHVAMPLQSTLWAQAFGVVTDRFGTPWEINCGDAG